MSLKSFFGERKKKQEVLETEADVIETVEEQEPEEDATVSEEAEEVPEEVIDEEPEEQPD